MAPFETMAHINSLHGKLDLVTVIHINNEGVQTEYTVIVHYNNVKCKAILNPFNFDIYADDIYERIEK